MTHNKNECVMSHDVIHLLGIGPLDYVRRHHYDVIKWAGRHARVRRALEHIRLA